MCMHLCLNSLHKINVHHVYDPSIVMVNNQLALVEQVKCGQILKDNIIMYKVIGLGSEFELSLHEPSTKSANTSLVLQPCS